MTVDQIEFMTRQVELRSLSERLNDSAPWSNRAKNCLIDLWFCSRRFAGGEVDRGDANKIMMVPERTARRIVQQLIDRGLLASDTPKGKLHLEFPRIVWRSCSPGFMDDRIG
jgi:hypothetical protein